MTNPSRQPLATAIVLVAATAADGGAAALLPWGETTVLRRLLDQLTTLPVGTVHVLARPGFADAVDAALEGLPLPAELHATDDVAADLRTIAAIADAGAATSEEAVIVVHGDVVTQREALAGLIADPRVATGVLSSTGRMGRPFTSRLRSRRGRIVAAGSVYHLCRRPNLGFLSVAKIAPRDRPLAASQASALAELVADPPPSWVQGREYQEIRWRHALARRQLRAAAGEPEPPHEPVGGDPGEPVDPPEELEGDHDHDHEHDHDHDHEHDHAVAGPAASGPFDLAVVDQVQLDADRAAQLRRRLAAGEQDAAALLVVGLVRGGAQLTSSYLRGLFWARPLTDEEVADARERIVRHDEDRVLLRSAVKATDGFFTTFFVSPYSRYIARWAARRGFTPNQITTFSLALALVTAALFATGDRWGLVAGAVLLQASFTFDCVDGQLARYTRRFSKLGAWLDSIFDRTKEYVVFAGLAIGAAAAGDRTAWLLAGCALTLQTVRHMSDFSWGTADHQTMATVAQPPLERSWDGAKPPRDPREPPPPRARREIPTAQLPPHKQLVRGTLRGWRRLDRMRGMTWLKRVLAFPIGERFAVISLTAAIWSGHTTFVVMLACGGFALAYTLSGRVLRSVLR